MFCNTFAVVAHTLAPESSVYDKVSMDMTSQLMEALLTVMAKLVYPSCTPDGPTSWLIGVV